MKKTTEKVVKRSPEPRRHQWKYVSPRRRKFGLFVLAIILGIFYAIWYVTSDSFVRRKAEGALERLLATDVDIESVDFSLEKGICLKRVEVWYPPKNIGYPYFYADEVVMSFSAWNALLNSRVEPVAIVCRGCIVSEEYSRNEKFLQHVSDKQSILRMSGQEINLPRIELKDFRRRKQKGDLTILKDESFRGTMIPSQSDQKYVLSVGDSENMEPSDKILAKWEIDVETSGIKRVFINFPMDRMVDSLPPWMGTLVDQYTLDGYVSNEDLPEEMLEKGWSGETCKLEAFSMALPPEDGGLHFSDVDGTIYFVKKGDEKEGSEFVLFENFRGIISKIGNRDIEDAMFTMEGRCYGYNKDSPFDINASISNLDLPSGIQGPLKDVAGTVRKRFGFKGAANLDIRLVRKKGDKRGFEGIAEVTTSGTPGIELPEIVYKYFPLKVHNPSGTIRFSDEGVDRFAIRAERDDARFEVEGRLWRKEGVEGNLFEITARGSDVSLDSALRSVLGDEESRLWDLLDPRGRCSMQVTVSRVMSDGGKGKDILRHLKIGISLNGFASLNYKGFPFRLEKLSGNVIYDDGSLKIDNLVSCHDNMICEINGTVSDTGESPVVNLAIVANRVPLDETLFSVLGEKTRQFVKSLRPDGTARRIDAKIFRKKRGGPLEHKAAIKIQNLSFMHKDFPVRVTGTSGKLSLDANRLSIDSISGQLDLDDQKPPVGISGSFEISGENPAYEINVEGKKIPLNKKLYKSLPAEIASTWDLLAPAGEVNISAAFSSDVKGERDYRVSVNADGVQLKPGFFPYVFRNVTGEAIVTPGLVVLKDIRSVEGKKKVLVNGQVQPGENDRNVNLSLSTRNLPVDKELLDAMSESAGGIFGMFNEGGELDMDLGRLKIDLPSAGTEKEDGKKTAKSWTANGTVVMKKCEVDFGFDQAVFSGRFSGTASGKGEKLSVNTDVRLNSLAIKNHVFNHFKGKLKKDFKNEFFDIGQVEADFYGGRIFGKGEVRLFEKPVFVFSSEIKNVDMKRLVDAWSDSEKEETEKRDKQMKIEGKLTGNLAVKLVSGENTRRMVQGEVVISRGNLYKLPVISGLFQVIYLSLPGDTAFNRGFVTYNLKDDELKFSEIYLTGKGMSILGSGSLDIKTEKLDLTFLTGPPGKLPRIENLATEVIRSISREIMQIRVKGTLAKPKMETVPLQSLNTILERILAPSRKTH